MLISAACLYLKLKAELKHCNYSVIHFGGILSDLFEGFWSWIFAKTFWKHNSFSFVVYFLFLICYKTFLGNVLYKGYLSFGLYNSPGIFAVLCEKEIISKHWNKLSWNFSQLVVVGSFSSEWIACCCVISDKPDVEK